MSRQLISFAICAVLAIGCNPGAQLPDAAKTPLTGSFRYTKTEGAFLVGGLERYEVLVKQTREIWIAKDGSGRLRVRFGAPMFFGEQDRKEWGSRTLPAEDTAYGAGGLAFTDLTKLPTDPKRLRPVLNPSMDPSDLGAGPPAWEIFMAARSYLWETVPPEAVTKALMATLRETPGVIAKDNQKDRAGRDATSMVVVDEHNQLRNTMLLDPVTGVLLGEQQELLKAVPSIDGQPPVTIKYATYVESRMVDSTADR